MYKLFIINALNLFLQIFAYAQSVEKYTHQDLVLNHQSIFGGRVGFISQNDFVILQSNNDTGYTAGINYNAVLSQPNRHRYFGIALTSDLYSSRVGITYQDPTGRRINPQYFVEISMLHLSYNKYIARNKMLLGLQLGGGIYNTQEAIPGFALFFQGGSKGREGFHRAIDDDGQDNIGMGGIYPDFYAQISAQWFYFLNKRPSHSFVSIMPKVRIGFPILRSSQMSLQVDSFTPLFRVPSYKKKLRNKFQISLKTKQKFIWHGNGMLYAPEVVLECDFYAFKFGVGNMFFVGTQQDIYWRYTDREPMLRLYGYFFF